MGHFDMKSKNMKKNGAPINYISEVKTARML